MPHSTKSVSSKARRVPITGAAGPLKPATRDILLAVTGESPAILTETIWCLATQGDEPFVPHEVIAITTTVGQAKLEALLLKAVDGWGGRTVWHALSEALAAKGLPVDGRLQLRVRLIEKTASKPGLVEQLDDIRDREDNEAAADSILRVAQEVCFAEQNRVVASVAGGRKSMGALMYAVMSLVGKEHDRVTHVLVDFPYDTRLDPMFYFPGQPVQELRDAKKVVHRADQAKLDLAEVPFVVLRRRFGDLAKREPTFMALVRRHNALLGGQGVDIVLDVAKGALEVDGERLPNLAPHHVLQLEFFLRLAEAELHPRDHAEACELFRVWRHKLLGELESADTAIVSATILSAVRQLPEPQLTMSLSTEDTNWLKALTGEDYKDPLSRVRSWLREKGSRWQMGTERAAYDLPPHSQVIIRR